MRFLLALVALAAAFGVVTLVAAEGDEVVVLRTRAADGTVRKTRTWIVDADGAAWVEAATPERPFLLDLRREPVLDLVRGGRVRRCAATVLDGPAGHARIRGLLRARYGWADRWIGLLADTHDSRAVRLECP